MRAEKAGPTRPDVDSAAADRGKRVYLQYCVNCHGSQAKGTEDGPDLIRSVTVLHDKAGSELAPALKKLAGIIRADFTQAQVRDLSQFLKQRVEETVKDRNATKPPNVLTGNAAAGKAYFEGQGKCNSCHSATGDFAGIAKRYDPLTLQQRLLFPRGGRPRNAAGSADESDSLHRLWDLRISGNLDRIDDFTGFPCTRRHRGLESFLAVRTAGLESRAARSVRPAQRIARSIHGWPISTTLWLIWRH